MERRLFPLPDTATRSRPARPLVARCQGARRTRSGEPSRRAGLRTDGLTHRRTLVTQVTSVPANSFCPKRPRSRRATRRRRTKSQLGDSVATVPPDHLGSGVQVVRRPAVVVPDDHRVWPSRAVQRHEKAATLDLEGNSDVERAERPAPGRAAGRIPSVMKLAPLSAPSLPLSAPLPPTQRPSNSAPLTLTRRRFQGLGADICWR